VESTDRGIDSLVYGLPQEVDGRRNRDCGRKVIRRIIVLEGVHMPEISRFFGIIIFMYFDEHNPPHFHVKYGEERAVLSINELKVMEGKLSRRALSLVLEWANEHRQELTDNWISLETTGNFSKIAPLE
jgi:hypothetical protein